MVPTHALRSGLLLGMLALLAACGMSDSAAAPTQASATTIATQPPATAAAPTQAPATTFVTQPPATAAATPLAPSEPSPTPLAIVPANVLIQLDYQPTYYRPETFGPAGRVPPFTLLDDGRVIYVDPGQPPDYAKQQVVLAQLTHEQTQALRQQVLDLGFERLESHTDWCEDVEGGQQICVADASYSILRVRLPSGELREISNYHDFANDPEALKAIRKLLQEYRAPGAQAFIPERATLFLKQTEGTLEGITVRDWPLDPKLLAAPKDIQQWAMALEQQDLLKLLAGTDRNMGDFYFRHAGRAYNAYLIPWLPGADFSDEVAKYHMPARPPEPTPTP